MARAAGNGTRRQRRRRFGRLTRSVSRASVAERCNCYYCGATAGPARAENNSINDIRFNGRVESVIVNIIYIYIPSRRYCYSKRTITRYNIILLFISYTCILYRYGVSETNIRQLGRSCFSCKYKHENRGTPPPSPHHKFVRPDNAILLSHQDFGRSRTQLRPKFQIVGPIERTTTAAAHEKETERAKVFYLV